MNKIIVADASPLIAFGRIDKLSLLSKLFENIIVPEAVANECLIDKTRPGAFALSQAIDHKTIQIYPDPLLNKTSELFEILDKGEAAAIKLAHTLNTPLIIDEKMGREAAKNLGIKIIGTVGVLLLAKQKKLIKKIQPIIILLKSANYYLSDTLIQEILTQAKEI